MRAPPHDLTRTVLAVLVIAGLLAGSLMVLGPFLPALVWAATLVIATWPLMERLQSLLWGRRSLAMLTMVLVLLLVVAGPLWLAIDTLVANASGIVAQGQAALSITIPPPPDWVADVPLIGERAAQLWQTASTSGAAELAVMAKPYAARAAQWLLSEVGNAGLMFLQFLLTVVLTAILYVNGDRAAAWTRRFALRLAGHEGGRAVLLIGQSVRSVALGIVVTALIQTIVGSAGLMISGVPFAAILSATMLILCIAQIGPGPVLIPAVVWMYVYDTVTWASVLLAFSILALTLDNLVRPLLIGRGLAMPMTLIMAGVIGGLIAFGLIGLFVGPAILAVSYALLQAWIEADSGDAAADTEAPPRS
jgi:predicted PurR-regulated permease PerM